MIKYIIEDGDKSANIFLVDEEYSLKIPVSIVFDSTHAKIIQRKLNDYVNENKSEEEKEEREPLFYVYLKSYSDGYLFRTTEWDEDVKSALLFVTGLKEDNLIFVINGEPEIRNIKTLDNENYIEQAEFGLTYWYDEDQIPIAKKHLEILKRVSS